MERARRHRGQGAIYQRPNGTWAAQIDLGVSPDGKRRRKTLYAPNHDAIIKTIEKARSDLRDRGDLPTSDITVEKWLRYWLTDIAYDRTKPRTYASYRTCIEQHIAPAIGKQRLARLAPAHVREMHKTLTGRGLSSTTALNAHRVLSASLNDAVREGRVARNVAALVRAPAKATSKRKGISLADTLKVLRVAGHDKRLGSRWMAAFLLGLRQGERLGLRWSALDLEAGTADVSWSLQRVGWAHTDGCARTPRTCPNRLLPIPAGTEHQVLAGNLVLLRPKSRDSRRVIPIPGPLVVALEQRAMQIPCERANYKADHDLVWCNPDGSPLDPRADWQAWRDMLTAAGVPLVTLHEARHTTASLLLDGGVDTRVISEILGHSDVVVTRGYQHVDHSLALRALNDLGRRLELPEADATA